MAAPHAGQPPEEKKVAQATFFPFRTRWRGGFAADWGTFGAPLGHLWGCFGSYSKAVSTPPEVLGVSALPMSTRTFSYLLLTASVAAGGLTSAFAQERIYRCGNEYTNNVTVAKAKGCKTMEGGNITIIQGPATPPAAAPRTASTAPPRSSAPKSETPEQRARDSDARQILEAELRKADQRLAEAQKAYANGQPEKEGIESRNHQRYLDRVANLKDAVTRAEADVSGLRRELGRLSGGGSGSGSASAAPAASDRAAQ